MNSAAKFDVSNREFRARISDQFVHHEYQHSKARRLKRAQRLKSWSRLERKARAKRYAERFGVGLEGNEATVRTERRRLRNARKQEVRS